MRYANAGFDNEDKAFMARPTLEMDCTTFLNALRRTGAAGNGALRESLGWTVERYWRVHAVLVETGRVLRGRGRGGSVRLP